jgi:signal transduction histidine kinase/DNA-binding response OmpR family regulator
MRAHPKLWAVFFVALGATSLAAQPFLPVFSRLQLPAGIEGKPIWSINRLSSGNLALGYEGGFAIGAPGGTWRTYESPNGQVVKVISQGAAGTLVAGDGFCAYLLNEKLVVDPALTGDYLSAVPLDDGWLVASQNEISRAILTESSNWKSFSVATSGETRLTTHGKNVISSTSSGLVNAWRLDRFEPFTPLAALGNSLVGWTDQDVFVTQNGIVNGDGSFVLSSTENRRELRGGIVGIAVFGPWLAVATFADGLSIYDRISGKLARKWNSGLGNIYWLSRDNGGLLVGTSSGAIFIADPYSVEFAPIENSPIFELLVQSDTDVFIVTALGTFSLGESGLADTEQQWPNAGASISLNESLLEFNGSVFPLPTRFVYGLSSQGDTVAALTETQLFLFDGSSSIAPLRLEGGLRGLAKDGRHYLVSTATRGVHVVSPQGQVIGRIGNGRAHVSEVRPGKVALLFWDGTILDSDANLLGKISAGNPRDATLVDGRLAVLVTRTDRDPIIGIIEGDQWLPLDVPGLAKIGAEQIAANDEFLFAAGPRGVIRVRLPLKAAAPPTPGWTWSGKVEGSTVTLEESSDEFVELSPSLGELAPMASTRFQVRIGDGKTADVHPGRPMQLPVGWGRTSVSTKAERNGLVTESTFTVLRPWPWWVRPWAWPLHLGACAGLVVGLVRLKMHRLERRNRELERRVALRTSELRKANAAKEEFLAGISHEIRNPLNGVVGICAMLADREVGPREKILVRTLGGCADQLRSMLDDILDFSRIERGEILVANQDFELSSLIEESAIVMDPERKACTLILPDEPIWLHGDSGKLRQIACNLVSNALKYGVPREAGIEVRVENAGGGRSRVRIAIRNSGPTIPADEIPRLFESFQRGSRTAGMPGSGLGLAVCRRLIQAMGGRITAASVDGVTEFAIEVLLPNARPPERANELPAMVSRALAIEDEDYNRIALGYVLRVLGYEVDWATDGASALKLASERQYDLVLTDWRLPDMNGGELCRRLLALLPNPKPPVIAVTAYSTSEKLDEAKAAGMTGYVTKPVTKEKLARVIRGLSEGLRPRRSLDINLAPVPLSPLASLGDLAPSCEQLAGDIAAKWRSACTLAELRDPRTPREAHALRSLLLLASEEEAAEQIALIENAAESSDWATVDKLLPFASEEITKTRLRLSA